MAWHQDGHRSRLVLLCPKICRAVGSVMMSCWLTRISFAHRHPASITGPVPAQLVKSGTVR